MPSTSQDLMRRIDELQRTLDEYQTLVRENEHKLRRFQEYELSLIAAAGFGPLFDALFHLPRRALGLDAVSLVLIDPEFEIRRTLEQLGVDASDYPDLVFVEDPARLAPLAGPPWTPQLGGFDPQCHGALFSSGLPAPLSVAVLPLVRHERPMGLLTLGSLTRDRFAPGMATDLIERIAAVVAVCLENTTYSERLKHMGLSDALTGVSNRRYFEQRLREELSRAQRRGTTLACLLLDIDHFKRINDSHGHQEGDRVLRETAFRIKNQLRLSDALARYGGEEFAALLYATDERLAVHIAERIRNSVAGVPFRLADGQGIQVTLSIGVAIWHPSAQPPPVDQAARELVERSDRALYHAKEQGRNRVGGDHAGAIVDRADDEPRRPSPAAL